MDSIHNNLPIQPWRVTVFAETSAGSLGVKAEFFISKPFLQSILSQTEPPIVDRDIVDGEWTINENPGVKIVARFDLPTEFSSPPPSQPPNSSSPPLSISGNSPLANQEDTVVMKKLIQLYQDRFDEEEFRAHLLDLGVVGLKVDYDSLDGKGKKGKVRALVEFAKRKGALNTLIAVIKKERPDIIVDWLK